MRALIAQGNRRHMQYISCLKTSDPYECARFLSHVSRPGTHREGKGDGGLSKKSSTMKREIEK